MAVRMRSEADSKPHFPRSRVHFAHFPRLCVMSLGRFICQQSTASRGDVFFSLRISERVPAPPGHSLQDFRPGETNPISTWGCPGGELGGEWGGEWGGNGGEGSLGAVLAMTSPALAVVVRVIGWARMVQRRAAASRVFGGVMPGVVGFPDVPAFGASEVSPVVCVRVLVVCVRVQVVCVRVLVVCVRVPVVCVRTQVVCVRMQVVCVRMQVVCVRMQVVCVRMPGAKARHYADVHAHETARTRADRRPTSLMAGAAGRAAVAGSRAVVSGGGAGRACCGAGWAWGAWGAWGAVGLA
jgi:hypothetical protein